MSFIAMDDSISFMPDKMMRKRKSVTFHFVAAVVLACYLTETAECYRRRKPLKIDVRKEADSTQPVALYEGEILFGKSLKGPTSLTDGTNQSSSNTSMEDEAGYQADYPGITYDQAQMDAWNKMTKSLQCGADQMHFKVIGAGHQHFAVNPLTGPSMPFPLVPPSCGYNMQRFPYALHLSIPYSGCNVLKEGGRYLLPLTWQGIPIVLSCQGPPPVGPVPTWPPWQPMPPLPPGYIPPCPWCPPGGDPTDSPPTTAPPTLPPPMPWPVYPWPGKWPTPTLQSPIPWPMYPFPGKWPTPAPPTLQSPIPWPMDPLPGKWPTPEPPTLPDPFPWPVDPLPGKWPTPEPPTLPWPMDPLPGKWPTPEPPTFPWPMDPLPGKWPTPEPPTLPDPFPWPTPEPPTLPHPMPWPIKHWGKWPVNPAEPSQSPASPTDMPPPYPFPWYHNHPHYHNYPFPYYHSHPHYHYPYWSQGQAPTTDSPPTTTTMPFVQVPILPQEQGQIKEFPYPIKS